MASARADPLRHTLDTLELDPSSASDRPYLIAMLRRLGYTERDIEEVIRTGKMPAGVSAKREDDGLAPARDYRLVIPARDSRFALDNTGRAGTDAPFEDLERVEFEDPSNDVVFEPVTEEVPAEPTWEEDALQEQAVENLPLDPLGAEGAPDAGDESGSGAEGAGRDAPLTDAELAAAAIDTFGDPNAIHAANRTRVRVRRVRAGSKEEAERKVSGKGRHVIKSVPVDIVERWGQGSNKPKEPKAPEDKA